MTPRAKFQTTAHGKKFLDMVDDPTFQTAVEFAMLQFVAHLQPANDMQIAAANGYRTEGARALIEILKALPIATQQPSKPPESNLKHKV